MLARVTGKGPADEEAGRPPGVTGARPISLWGFTGVAVTSAGLAMAAAPVMLIDPEKIYDSLITPSLAGLWLSQLVVLAVYPRFAARRGKRALPARTLAVAASAFAVYGLWTTIQVSNT